MAQAPRPSWLNCMREQLAARGMGHVRLDAIEARVANRAARYRNAGDAQPEARAVAEEMAAISLRAKEKARGALIEAERTADVRQRIEDNISRDMATRSSFVGKGRTLSRIADSFVEHQPGVTETSTGNLRDMEKNYLERIRRAGADVFLLFGKGTFGRQRGEAYGANVAREIINGFGSTGDKIAERIGRAWAAAESEGINAINSAGGAIQRLEHYLPQITSPARLITGRESAAEGVARYIKTMEPLLAWERMSHPDGTAIVPAERGQYLSDVFHTIWHDGANKESSINTGGRGSSIGYQLDNHRQLLFKDGDSWMAAHNAYGEGHMFDVMNRHLSGQARTAALVHVFGRNPEIARTKIVSMLEHAAAKEDPGGTLQRSTTAGINGGGGFHDMMDTVLHTRPTDPYSTLGTLTTTTKSLLRGAMLGGVSLASAAPDMAQRIFRRVYSGQGAPLGGLTAQIKALTQPITGSRLEQQIWAQKGIFHDDLTAGLAEHRSRFDGVAAGLDHRAGLAAGLIYRASGMTALDIGSARAVRSEIMGFLYNMKGRSLDKLPGAWQSLCADYGIDAADWDAFRVNTPASSYGSAKWLAPIDILGTSHPDKEALFNKFNSLIQQESYTQFADSPTIRAQALGNRFKGGGNFLTKVLSEPVQSSLMFKSFSLSFMMQQARVAMRDGADRPLGRLGYMGGMAAAMAAGGAIAVTAKALAQGKTVDPSSASFWWQSLLAGGGLGYFGDSLQNAMQGDFSKVAEGLVGPLTTAEWYTASAGFKWAQAGAHAAGFDKVATLPGQKKPVDFSQAAQATLDLRKYFLPGNNLWYARLLLEREVGDRLSVMIDPSKRQQQINETRKAAQRGTPYWWAPGS